MIVAEEERWNFCYVLPTPPGDPIQIVVPSALQMGWTESPGFFAAPTETIRDNIQHDLDCQVDLKAHPMEPFTTPTEPIEPGGGRYRYGNYVYIDNFINIASEDESRTRLTAVARHPYMPSTRSSHHRRSRGTWAAKTRSL
jgi:hypothetical protein